MNTIERFKNGGFIRKMLTAAGGPIKKFRTRDINGNWVYMDMKTGRTTSAGPESGTIRNNAVNSVGGDNKTKRGRTLIAKNQVTSYNNRLHKVHNYADTKIRSQLKNLNVVLDNLGEPLIILADYTPTLEAPMKIVSPEFDLLTLGRQAATSMYKAAKPTVNVMADATPEVKSATTLSQEQIKLAFDEARRWHLNRINSSGYKDRALRAGFTEEEIPQLLQQLTTQLNNLRLQNREKLFPSLASRSNANGKINANYWKVPTNKGMYQGIGFYNPNMSYDLAVSTFIHEFGHGITFGLNGNETIGLSGKLAKQFPLINRVVKYNKSLYPEVTEETVGKVFPWAAKTGNLGYYAEPTELQSRGYEFMRDYATNWFKARNSGTLSSATHMDLVGDRLNSKLFNAFATPKGAANFQKNALSIGAPTGIAGTYLYNNLDDKEIEYLRQGGKMNILEFLKNGSGIHIKKKNRGSFTRWCGGNVTNECILRGKNSSNPAIRKKATFAANARKWKHRLGGQIKLKSKLYENN